MDRLRVVFMGTPELSVVSLRALLASSHFDVVGVVTQPDKPKGRDLRLQSSPVKQLALNQNLPVFQPSRAREEVFLQQMCQLRPELIAVAAFGQILPQSLLDLPRYGCVNVHTSLLPKYRGAAPIQWAILNGESETGVTIMKMDAGLDTGPILSQETTAIAPEDTSETLHARLADLGARLLVRTLPDYVEGKLQPTAQPTEGVSFAPRIKKEDGKLDWTQPAQAVWNRVRGLVPWPGAFTHLSDGSKKLLLKIWRAEVTREAGMPGQISRVGKEGIVVACGRDALRILELQREAGRRLTAEQFLSGHKLAPGHRLG